MDMDQLCEALKKKRYIVSLFETCEDAVAYLNEKIDGCSVGFGDSQTLKAIKLYEKLSLHNRVFDPSDCVDEEDFIDTATKCLITDIFITSVNAIAQTGELINIDGTGNRISGSLFGHKKVYFVVGKNKIAHTIEQAIHKARNIAAPRNAQRLGLKTPCAKNADRCFDCTSPDRICNSMVIHYAKMDHIEMEIVLIDTELGF